MAKKNQVIQENVPVTPTNDWINLHIYGFGQTQLNENNTSDNVNNVAGDGQFSKIKEKRVLTSTLTKAQAVIDFVYGKKPVDSDAGVEFHAVTIVKDIHCLYVPKNSAEKYFRIEYKDLDATIIEDLVAELRLVPSIEDSSIENAPIEN
jgi:hypothetical protein